MISKFTGLFAFSHVQCKKDLHTLMQTVLTNEQTIKSLNSQNMVLVKKYHELVGINDYQTGQLEKRVDELQSTIDGLKSSQKKEETNE